jgi:hypothetical protein
VKNNKQTSKHISELAAKTLADEQASKRSKSLAGSALAQAKHQRKVTRSKHDAALA